MVPNRQRRRQGPYPVQDGERVPGVGISKCEDTEHLTEPGLVELQKPRSGKKGNERGVSELHTCVHSKYPRASHQRRQSTLHNFLQQLLHQLPWLDLRCEETSGESISWHLRSNGIRMEPGGLLVEALQAPSYLTAREPFGRAVPARRETGGQGQLWGPGPGGAHLRRPSCLTGQSHPGDYRAEASAQLGV